MPSPRERNHFPAGMALLGAVLLVLASATGLGAAPGRTLTVAINTDPDGLNPYKTVAAATFEVACNIYDTLVQTDAAGRLHPGLAAGWKVSQDGLKLVFDLRTNVYFHHGRLMTPEDVKWSLEQMRDPKTHKRAADFANIAGVAVTGPHQVTVTLAAPQASFLSNLAMGWAAILPQDGGGRVIGTGPFRLVEWQRDQEVVLERFPKYYRPSAIKIDRAVFKIIPNPGTRLMALKAGSVDVVPDIPPENAEEIKSDDRLKLLAVPMNAVQLLAMNNNRRPFNDVRVRQALALAIDKTAVIKGSTWGYGQPIASHMPPTSAYYVDLTARYPTDLNRARQLLAQAGLADGFKTVIVLPEPYAMHRKAGEVIAEQLRALKIQADLKVIDWPTWLQEVYTNRNYDLTVIGHTGRLDPDPFLNRYVTGNKEDYMNFSDPAYDDLIARAAVTADSAKRKRLYRQAQEILAEKAPAVYLQSPMAVAGLKKDVRGWQVYPIDVYDLRGVSKQP